MAGIAQQIALPELRLANGEHATTRDEEFTALVWRQSRFVFRVAYSILRNVHDSDDVVQETFLKVYRSRAWERMADEKAFLARVAWRIAVRQVRRAPTNALSEVSAPTSESPEHTAILSDMTSTVRRLIDALPEELRQPLALAGVEELNSREIAEIMGIPEGTVRSRLAHARQILRQKLGALRAGANDQRRS